jgi:predicted choloylglycine hydrolase
MKYIKLFGVVIVLLLSLNFCKKAGDPVQQETREERFQRLMATYDQDFLQYLDLAHQALGKEIIRYSPLSDTKTIPKYMEITGTHYEYGYLVGHIFQQYGRSPRRITSAQRELNNRIINMYQQLYPQYLDLVRGVGDVFGIPIDELDFIYLESEFFLVWYSIFKYNSFQTFEGSSSSQNNSTANHCSMIFANVYDDIYVGRNFDDAHEKPHFVVLTQMEGAYKVMANAVYSLYHWIMDGVNEKGLFMGTANLVQPADYYWFDDYPNVPAICEHHLFRIALETCATVDEVIELYSSIQPWVYNGTDHLLVVDALGNSAVIEFDMNRRPSFFRADKNYQIMTNIAYHEGFDFMMENCPRFRTGTNAAELGIHSYDDVETITRTIRGTDYGYTSLFDLGNRFMQVYRRTDFFTPYNFTCPD